MKTQGLVCGDRVRYDWQQRYRFWCKEGVFNGKIHHTIRYKGPQLAYVFFVGNSRYSRVRLDRLVKI